MSEFGHRFCPTTLKLNGRGGLPLPLKSKIEWARGSTPGVLARRSDQAGYGSTRCAPASAEIVDQARPGQDTQRKNFRPVLHKSERN